MPMPKATSIKPTHKALKKYYAALQSYRDDGVTHEGALETAFQRLLDEETAKSHGWKLIPKTEAQSRQADDLSRRHPARPSHAVSARRATTDSSCSTGYLD